ncbi:protein of unknown function [Candidatus Methylomirabilis oxygeniifera]|uniref:Uncharacterized protein n=1 Tax=Methylomirabilis oxygeniifera TaxID=671143 RepID=D5MFG8_METO1|nr:protein of unknown function [Candidatus Methylomirabilis oxyfera]
MPRIDIPHNSKLEEVSRLAIGIGADIQQDRLTFQRWNDESDGGTLYARKRTQGNQRRGHHRPRIPGADKGIGLPILDEIQADPDGRLLLLSQGGGRGFLHPDRLRGVSDRNAQALRGVLFQCPANFFFVPDQQDRQVEFTGGGYGALDGNRGTTVATHRVKGYTGSHTCVPIGNGRLDLLPLHNLPTTIIATGGASAMGQLPLMAVGALRERRGGEGVMSASCSRPRITVTAFWKGHRSSSWISRGLE